MTKHPTDRRTVLMTAGAAAVTAAAGPVAAQSPEIRGTVGFEGGAAIPEGRLAIYLEDPAIEESAQRRLASTHIESDGRSRSLAFSLPGPASPSASTERVVARLERADGWLLARGSAPLNAGSPVPVTLYAVTY